MFVHAFHAPSGWRGAVPAARAAGRCLRPRYPSEAGAHEKVSYRRTAATWSRAWARRRAVRPPAGPPAVASGLVGDRLRLAHHLDVTDAGLLKVGSDRVRVAHHDHREPLEVEMGTHRCKHVASGHRVD